MRDKKTLIETFSEVTTLMQYLYCSKDNFVQFNNGSVDVLVSMTDDLEFEAISPSWPDDKIDYSDTMTLSQMVGIIDYLKVAEADDSTKFSSRWDEISYITNSQVAWNAKNYYIKQPIF